MLREGFLLFPAWGFPPALASPPHQAVSTHSDKIFHIFNGWKGSAGLEDGGAWAGALPLYRLMPWAFPFLLSSVCRQEPPGLQGGLIPIPTGLNCPNPASFQRLPPVAGSRSCFPAKTRHFWEPSVCNLCDKHETRAHLGTRHPRGAACQETKPPRI